MKRWMLSILICVILGTNLTYVQAEDHLQLYAKAAVLLDADSGRILFSKNGQEIMPMASTTKIMTCILALEYAKYDDVIEFTENAVSQPKVHLGAGQGERFLLRDLLYSLMLESHNDTAVAIAEGISGSVHDFTELMNAKATSIGCRRTHFVTPNGLDASDLGGVHATTASDLARIMKYCIYDSDKREEFLQITREGTYTFSNVDGTHSYSCNNHNAFLQMMDGALSGKTGFTADAGYCYVGALESDGRTFIVALLACGWPNHKGYKWSDTQELMKYGIENYHYETIKPKKLKAVAVKNAIPEKLDGKWSASLKLKYAKDLSGIRVLKKQDEKIEETVSLESDFTAPFTAGERVGSIQYRIGGNVIAKTDIVSENGVQKWNFQWTFMYIGTKFMRMLN
ncbi:MAG: D-alanyl-D-alanine carboxypeptidase [Hespellia sp.]|nr:D-alanyl-D-alanine carboxypeptidase [Hespellia sp.]